MLHFENIELVKDYVFHRVIRLCMDILVQSQVDPNTIMQSYASVNGGENGEATACAINSIGENGMPHSQFTIYKFADHPNIRVVFENLITSNGPSIVEFIVRYDDEFGIVRFEYAPLVQPTISNGPTMMIPYAYQIGMFSAVLENIEKQTTPPGYDPDGTNAEVE